MRGVIVLSSKVKRIIHLMVYTLIYNVFFLAVNMIATECAQIGFIYTYIILMIQIISLPIYFYLVGKISKKLHNKELIAYMCLSLIIGAVMILFSMLFYFSTTMIDLYIQGIACSFYTIGILIEQKLYIETSSLYLCISLLIFIIEIICKVIFIKIGNKNIKS